MIHAFTLSHNCQESRTRLNDFFQIVPGGLKIVGACFVETRDFDPVRTDSVNTIALFGAGWVDRISSRTILYQSRNRSIQAVGRELTGNLNGLNPGRPRILPDGRVGKFGWKAQFATLKEFVAAACANELGLGNPLMDQARPFTHEGYVKVAADLNQEQFGAMVAFVDTLPRPVEIPSADPERYLHAARGKALFHRIGCAVCHTAKLGGVEGVYSDLLLHRLGAPTDRGGGYTEVPATPLPDEHPLPDEWKTPPLWGVADSAPYFHDGGAPTLEAAILRHRGDATSVTQAFENLPAHDRTAVLSFLESLKAPSGTTPDSVMPARARHLAMAP
jgi:CxxC motif-containing protein (DUF1111 family)